MRALSRKEREVFGRETAFPAVEIGSDCHRTPKRRGSEGNQAGKPESNPCASPGISLSKWLELP